MTSDSNQSPRLDYESAADQVSRRPQHVGEFIMATILSCGTAIGAVCLYIVCNLNIHAPPPNKFTGIVIPVVCAVAAGGALVSIAYYRWKKRGSKAFAAGLLIGLGIAALLEGLCFAMLK